MQEKLYENAINHSRFVLSIEILAQISYLTLDFVETSVIKILSNYVV